MPYFHFQVPSTISIVLSCGGQKRVSSIKKNEKKRKNSMTNTTNKMHPDPIMLILEQDLFFEFSKNRI